MKNKKGSHIGVILSFVLFITFLIFAYLIVGPPTLVSNEKENSIEFLESKVLDEIQKEVIIIRSYDDSSSESCISLDMPDNDFTDATLIVKDENNQEISSDILGNNILVQSNNGFTKAFLSNGSFDKSLKLASATCVDVNPTNVLIEKKILEKEILVLIDRVENDYENLKQFLGVSQDDEFNILFDYSNGTIIGEEGRNIKTSIYAKSINMNYLSFEAEEKIGKLVMKIW